MNATNQFKDKKNNQLELNSFTGQNRQDPIKPKPHKNAPTRKETPQEIVKKITHLIERNYHLFGGWTNSFDDITFF